MRIVRHLNGFLVKPRSLCYHRTLGTYQTNMRNDINRVDPVQGQQDELDGLLWPVSGLFLFGFVSEEGKLHLPAFAVDQIIESVSYGKLKGYSVLLPFFESIPGLSARESFLSLEVYIFVRFMFFQEITFILLFPTILCVKTLGY